MQVIDVKPAFTLRSPLTQQLYDFDRKRNIRKLEDEPSIREFKNWRVIENKYPYDKIAVKHHLLLANSGAFSMNDLTRAETVELIDLLTGQLSMEYDVVMYNMPAKQSVKNLLHFHLCTYIS